VKDAIAKLLGHHVAARRLQAELTQEQLAGKVKISRQALSEIERGTQSPSWQTLYTLSNALRCEPWDLLPSYRQVVAAITLEEDR
jgi:transcriptional regulator with XRE-family HTH domain